MSFHSPNKGSGMPTFFCWSGSFGCGYQDPKQGLVGSEACSNSAGGSGLVWSTQRGFKCVELRLWPLVVLYQGVAIVWWSVFDLNFTAVRSQNFGFGHMPFLIWPCRGIGAQWQGPWEESTGHYTIRVVGDQEVQERELPILLSLHGELDVWFNWVRWKLEFCAGEGQCLCPLSAGMITIKQSPWRDLSALDSTSVMLEGK